MAAQIDDIGRSDLFSLADRAADPVVISVAATGEFVYVNDAFVEMIGHARDELIGRTSIELGIAKSDVRARTYDELQRRSGYVSSLRSSLVRSDGRVVNVSLSANVVSIPALRPEPLALMFLRDITTRLAAERYRAMHRNVLELLATDLAVPDMAGAVASSITQSLGWSGCIAWRLDDELQHLAPCFLWIEPDQRAALKQVEEVALKQRLDLKEGLVGTCYVTRQVVWIEDIATAEDVLPKGRELAVSLGIHSLICVPVVSVGGVRYVFELFDTQRQPRDEDNAALLRHIGELIGSWIDRREDQLVRRQAAEHAVARYHRATRDYESVVRHRMFNPLAIIEGVLRTIEHQPNLDEGIRGQLIASGLDACSTLHDITLEPFQRHPLEADLQPSPDNSDSPSQD